MEETRAVINRFIATFGRQAFQIISGLSDTEVAQVLNPHNNLDNDIVCKILKAVEMIISITDRSRRGDTKSKIKVAPSARLIAEVKQIAADTGLSIANLAYMVNVSQRHLRSWLHGAENRFGWARVENNIKRELPTLRNATKVALNTPHRDHMAVNVREFVDGYLLSTGSTTPTPPPNCNIH